MSESHKPSGRFARRKPISTWLMRDYGVSAYLVRKWFRNKTIQPVNFGAQKNYYCVAQTEQMVEAFFAASSPPTPPTKKT